MQLPKAIGPTLTDLKSLSLVVPPYQFTRRVIQKGMLLEASAAG